MPKEGTLSTPELEEAMLTPLRPVMPKGPVNEIPQGFDPGDLEPDLISLELEVAASILCIYGSLLRNFLHVKVSVSLITMRL